ncbi:hypothetical protein [Haloplanus aerogenes]|uniref:Homeodomain-like domain-containing protein n=1 Tax=Haloplanus aerogenes TaxID=660522 RepID=A0A3M0CV84_9EURY|nr:hypothetical protein [Haloplanus aerogenes]AZH26679.1 hypothetical protein DU502_15420 [Haloplanus aerogenes]RMB12917.1 hypothetical protein ATH50_3073 [Haloplanus aerogenes]
MEADRILNEYDLSKETAARYIDAITRMNQSETAEEIGVSRQTVNRYKNVFAEMTAQERSLLIASLAQDQFLEQATE